jgi:hypothetical protein
MVTRLHLCFSETISLTNEKDIPFPVEKVCLFCGADNHKGHGKNQRLCGFAAIGNVYIV